MTFQQRPQDILAGRCAIGVGFLQHGESLFAAELPGEFAPKGAVGLLAVLPRLAG